MREPKVRALECGSEAAAFPACRAPYAKQGGIFAAALQGRLRPQFDSCRPMSYDQSMRRPNGPPRTRNRGTQVPVFIEKGEDGFYVVECPLFEGCYSQGKTIDEALLNIREVIEMIVEEKRNRDILNAYHPKELSLHTITV